MTTTATYNLIKKALVQQRALVTATPKRANEFLTNVGLGEVTSNSKTNPSSKKKVTGIKLTPKQK
ncbi:hypothetical protein [Chitinophaga sp. sic0106]|uniref:hypothetical protein n=1 Tax=Chitinophaga sp. sic0106 TaxID=2854785 RepID=UPI001C43C381|nr:hypothetical protein [Chitinophaga sp. sic0106]MBV7533214.1 hypothetical protein [Chitinophaga sp. sic0106]